jgi:hypothetical protein
MLCVIFVLGIATSISNYRSARCFQRELISVPCPSCHECELSLTDAPLSAEAHRFSRVFECPGRYVQCRKCGAAFFASPPGLFSSAIAIPGASFELNAKDAESFKQGLNRRRTARRRLIAIGASVTVALTTLYVVSRYFALPACEIVAVTWIVGSLLLWRRAQDFIAGYPPPDKATTSNV